MDRKSKRMLRFLGYVTIPIGVLVGMFYIIGLCIS